MTITQTFSPLRPLRAPDGGSAFAAREVLGTDNYSPAWRVFYGESHWPSQSYWMVPGTCEVRVD
jgi:hypothetical protein